MSIDQLVLIAATLGGGAGIAALVKAIIDGRNDDHRIDLEREQFATKRKELEADLTARVLEISRTEMTRVTALLDTERQQREACMVMLRQLQEAQHTTDREITKLKKRLEDNNLPTNGPL